MNEKTEKKAEEQAEESKAVKRTQSEQLRLYKERYVPYQLGNGNVSMDNGDDVAATLRGTSPEAIIAAAEKLQGLEPGTLKERYAKLNPGSQRMNAGNIIRGYVKRGDKTVEEIQKTIKDVSKTLNTAS